MSGQPAKRRDQDIDGMVGIGLPGFLVCAKHGPWHPANETQECHNRLRQRSHRIWIHVGEVRQRSTMEPLPSQRRGFLAPRTRLKILAAIIGLSAISTLSNLMLPDVPVWITIGTMLANVAAAGMLWRLASASLPTQPMIGSALLTVLALISLGIVYTLQPFVTLEPVVTIPVNVAVGGVLLVFVHRTARAIQTEGALPSS